MDKLVNSIILVTIFSTVIQNAPAELTMEEIMSTSRILSDHCKSQTGASDESIQAASQGRFSDDRPFKCFLACMMGMAHSLKDGKFQADLQIQLAEDLLPAAISGRVKNMVQKCRNAGDGINDECDMAMALTKCGFDADPELFFLP